VFQLIASYPKSGNTYVRVFLAHYLRGETDLNKVGWPLFTSAVYFPFADPKRPLPRNRIPKFDTNYIAKTHELGNLYSGRYVDRAVYLIRNPLDVVPSYARHMSISIDRAIMATANKNNKLKHTERIFSQRIGSWTTNITSWLRVTEFPVLYLRYETLLSDPAYAFKQILTFLDSGTPMNAKKFSDALEFTRFENLKKKEVEKGFKEARGSTGKFFNVGTSGQWKTALTPAQIDRVKSIHGDTMKLVGYL
jgi:hypothetical protein